MPFRVLALLVFLVPALSAAAPKEAYNHTYLLRNPSNEAATLLSAVRLDAAEATRTTEALPMLGIPEVTFWVSYTRGGGSAVATLTLACQSSPDGTAWATLDYADASPGASTTTVTYQQAIHTRAVSASTAVRFVVGPLNDKYIKCTVGSSGAAVAADVFTLHARAGVL